MADTVQITLGSARYEINLSMVTKMTVGNWRKMCHQLKRYSWLNTDAIPTIYRFWSAEIERTKDEWRKASREYSDGYELPAGHPLAPHYTKFQARTIEAKNKKLLRAVKSTKHAHDRAVKYYTIFTEELN